MRLPLISTSVECHLRVHRIYAMRAINAFRRTLTGATLLRNAVATVYFLSAARLLVFFEDPGAARLPVFFGDPGAARLLVFFEDLKTAESRCGKRGHY